MSHFIVYLCSFYLCTFVYILRVASWCNAIDTVKVCHKYFNFELPSVMTEKRQKTFLSRLSRLDTLACYLVKIS